MTTLPITRMVLFKHGVGYFERRGAHSGEQLELSFSREAMDDVLKSLIALDLGAGQVLGVDFETPEDREQRLQRGSIHLSHDRSLLDLLRDLRGRRVRLQLAETKHAPASSVEGLVVGVDYVPNDPLRHPLVSLYNAETRLVQTLAITRLAGVELLEPGAAADLSYFLRAAQSEEQRRAATLRLSPGDHDLLVGYIAPAPAWRVSYRLLFEAGLAGAEDTVVLQGWGLFDNQLEEDLNGVALTLMAGMPVSFRYRLYEPHTPERPLVEDEERTVNAPIAFAAAPPPAPMMMADVAEMALGETDAEYGMPPRSRAFRPSAAQFEEAVQVAAGGDERGALFAYEVVHPVSVARGQSAMVPIVSQRLPARHELLYNGAKHPRHPVAALRLQNGTGLTLERGPVTVLCAGDYGGEAVLPFTRTGGELIVPFAIELGLTVEEQHRGERKLASLHLRDEYLIFEEHDLATTSYHITSGLERAAEVTIEHVPRNGYELVSPTKPDEQSAGFVRWRVACAPQARTVFEVTERRLISRHEQVRSLNGQQLQAFLRDRLLTAETVAALQEVLALYHRAQAAQNELTKLERERDKLYRQQTQIQKNLVPLGREGDEGNLRQRYVNTLNQLEDQLAASNAEELRLQAELVRIEQEAVARLKAV
ncbi:hypothetical protein [Candidatus Viridilinea mediisalina]|uniref:DUF4139 domain-containing protein n=1 Tax=Candidatus Viridilinea mediisalina TaxID=2024553 RepID=A0A2A6RE74_9CHLR|nr:hypothetical protein [Candidatus Viridilinea mediisalina]PDW00624.1 hypothetical protein CJ255_20440 [Candidatus Viridilinea mediisalina]